MGLRKFIFLLNGAKMVGLDTSIFIYGLEKAEVYYPFSQKIFEKIEKGKLKAVTSIISFIETLSPKKLLYAEKKILGYKRWFIEEKNLETKLVDWEIAEEAARIRRVYNLRTPDSIQIATAIVSHSDLFITNDPSFKKVKEMKSLVLREFV